MKTRKFALKAISLFLVMAFAGGILSFPAHAENETETSLFVGGVEVTLENCEDILGDGTASYDFEDSVLTLKNADIKIGSDIEATSAIEANSDLNIHLVGENKIEAPSIEAGSNGIFVKGDLSISGESLIVKGCDITSQNDKVIHYAESIGIYSGGKVTVSGAKVEAHGGNLQGTIIMAGTLGAYIGGSVEIKDGGNLFAFGGNVGGSCTVAMSYGLRVAGTEENLLYVIVRDGGIIGNGGNVTALIEAYSIGANMQFCDVGALINDSYMEFEGGEAVTTDDSDETEATSNGICIVGGNFAADGGNIHFTSKKCQGALVDGTALFVDTAMVNGRDFGGNIALYCDSVEINSYGYGFNGTKVNVSSASDRAIVAKGEIEISDKLEITTPENAAVFKDEKGYSIIKTSAEAESVSSAEIGLKIHKVLLTDALRNLSILVPEGESINEAYCDYFEIDDFSEYLKTEKEGFSFGGWYSDAEFSTEFDFDFPIFSDMTVCGKWTEISSDSSDTSDSSDDSDDSDSSDTSDASEPTDDDAKPGDMGYSTYIVLGLISVVFVSFVLIKKKRI